MSRGVGLLYPCLSLGVTAGPASAELLRGHAEIKVVGKIEASERNRDQESQID